MTRNGLLLALLFWARAAFLSFFLLYKTKNISTITRFSVYGTRETTPKRNLLQISSVIAKYAAQLRLGVFLYIIIIIKMLFFFQPCKKNRNMSKILVSRDELLCLLSFLPPQRKGQLIVAYACVYARVCVCLYAVYVFVHYFLGTGAAFPLWPLLVARP